MLADALEEAGRRTEALQMRAGALIQKQRRSIEARLVAEHEEARAADLAAHRLAFVAGVEPGSAAYAVCALVSETVTIGRADGYPCVSLPEDTRRLVLEAVDAEVLPADGGYVPVGSLRLYRNGQPAVIGDHLPTWEADYKAWKRLDDWRQVNRGRPS